MTSLKLPSAINDRTKEPDTDFEKLFNYNNNLICFNQKHWQILKQLHQPKRLKKGQFLVKEGRVCSETAFITKGIFASSFSNNQNNRIRGFFCEDMYVSDYRSFLTGLPATSNVEAITDCEVLLLSKSALDFCYTLDTFYEKWGRLMAEQSYVHMFNRIEKELTQTPEERYCELAIKHPHLLQRVPLYLIASYIGVTPEALSRIRKRIS